MLVEATDPSSSALVGACVFVSKYAGVDIALDGVDYVVVNASDVEGSLA